MWHLHSEPVKSEVEPVRASFCVVFPAPLAATQTTNNISTPVLAKY